MKTALITGASSGIATAVAQQLERQGWQLSLSCRDASRLAPAAHVHSADVSTELGAQAALDAATAFFGQAPDAVINCAGSSLVAPITRTTEAQYRNVLAANLDSCFFVAKAYAAVRGRDGKGGALLFFSSVVSRIGVGNHAAIAAAKGGIEALTRALAADFSASGLRVNCIAPGLTRTPMTERMLGNEASLRQIDAQYPLGRHGEAQDIAALGAFLCSDASGWITGQVIGVDGGFSSVRPFVKVA